MDERNKQVGLKIIAIMYFFTLIYLAVILAYRQLLAKQAISEFEDIAIIVTINVLFLISGFLYFGAIPIRRIKIKTILLIYLLFVFLGSVFTYVKYNIILDYDLSFQELLNKLIIIISILGIMIIFFIILSVMGKRKIDKEIE